MKLFYSSITHFIGLLYFLVLIQPQLIKKAPPFFCSFKCSFGLTNGGSNSNYTCTTPNVVPRVKRYSAAMSQIDKDPSSQIQIIVTIYSGPSTNVTSFIVGFNHQGISDLYLSYFVVVVGDQPQNDWVDLVRNSLSENPSVNTLMTGDSSTRFLQWDAQASNFIQFADLTGVTLLTFISSIKTLTYSSLPTTQVQLSSWAINSTHFKTKISVTEDVACKQLHGFTLFYKASQINNEAGFYKHDSFNLAQNADTFIDFSIRYPGWGPSFDTKCFFGYWETTYHLDQDVNLRFFATMKGHFYRFTYSSTNSLSTNFKGSIFCLANGTECGENQNFYDKKTGLCYTASGCPVTTPDPGNAIPLAEYCQLCVDDECTDCLNSNRSHCTQCNLTKYTQAVNGSCVCTTGYHRPSTVCIANCSYHLPGCLLMNCTSTTFCNQCAVGYYLNNISSTEQNCIKCSNTIPNCLQCGIMSSCTIMCQPYCSKCDYLYGQTITQECDLCSSLINHCLQCSDNTYCEKCEVNNLTYFHGGICLKCTDIDPQCNGCSYDGIGITCTSCQAGYYLDPVSLTCQECSLAIKDCQECLFNVFSNQVQCTLCTAIFLVDDNFTCEKCKLYTYVTGTCSNISGCASSYHFNGALVCLSCDATLYFVYNITTKVCQCMTGFLFNSIQDKCIQICGDGTRESMECDDGNLINYDGCSQTCKIQGSYTCEENNQGMSVCTLNQDITVVYDYMLRHLDENKVSLYFTVTPPSTALNKVDWLKTITFNFSEPVSLQVSYSNGILVVTLQYTSDIEDKILNLDIAFNSTLIKSQPQNLTLKMNAINGPLTYSQSFGSFKAFKYTGLVIGIICLLFYLISSYFHKMIGLETIQFIQLIYFSRLISQNANQSSFYGLNSLKYSNGYNELTSGHTSVETYKSLQPSFIKLELSLYFLDNCNLMLIPIFLASIGYVWYSVKKSYHRSKLLQKNERIHQDKYTIASRKVELFYDNLIFSFTLSLMYVTFFSSIVYLKSNQISTSTSNDIFRAASLGMNLLVLFYLFGIFSFEFTDGIKKHLETSSNSSIVVSNQKNIAHDANKIGNGFQPLYVPVYLFYQLTLIVVMNLIFTNFHLMTEALLTVCVLYLILIIYWRPYQLNFHNYAIIANQITLVFFVAVLTLLRYKVFNADFLTAVITLTLISISVSTLFQIVRLYLHRKLQQKSCQQNETQLKQKSKDKLKGLLNQHNPFLLENQIKAFQQTEAKQIQKNLFGKYQVENYSQNYKKFFFNKKNLTIKVNIPETPKKISSLSMKTMNQKLEQNQQKQDIFAQNEQEDSYLQELNQVKYRLRNQLNHQYK